MSEVRAHIDIDAPPEAVYDLMLDPSRLHDWVTIHRKVNHADSGEPRGDGRRARARGQPVTVTVEGFVGEILRARRNAACKQGFSPKVR